MGANAKVVKRRIRSIGNTMKITKAMELVAASKMRRATQAVLGTRPFSHASWAMLRSIAHASASATHPLLEKNADAPKTLIVLFTSDRGLAGGFNVNVIKKALHEISAVTTHPIEAITVGRRGADALARKGIEIIARFEDISNKPTFEDILPVAQLAMEGYTNKQYKRVLLVYTDFVSSLAQVPRVIELLPFSAPDDQLGEIRGTQEETSTETVTEYLFEPTPQAVLERTLPRLMETMMYQALLESSASEHSARMMAMRNATDSAREMLKELTFTFNRIRQASITQEIAEISSGKAAIE